MADDKYINTETEVTTTVTTITIFSEYVEKNLWILATDYWDNEGIWINTEVWQTP